METWVDFRNLHYCFYDVNIWAVCVKPAFARSGEKADSSYWRTMTVLFLILLPLATNGCKSPHNDTFWFQKWGSLTFRAVYQRPLIPLLLINVRELAERGAWSRGPHILALSWLKWWTRFQRFPCTWSEFISYLSLWSSQYCQPPFREPHDLEYRWGDASI